MVLKNGKNIIDLQNGDKVSGVYVLGSWSKDTTKTGSNYGSTSVVDSTGTVAAKFWSAYDNNPDMDYSALSGELVQVEGDFQVNNYGKQIIINRLTLVSPEDLSQSDLDMSLLVKEANVKAATAHNTLVGLAQKMEHPILKEFSLKTLEDFKDVLMIAPAAEKMHHATLGGLVNHTLEMALTADAVAKIYGSMGYEIDRDFLLASVIAHDIMKPIEMDYALTGIVKNYSFKGHALGHIYMGATYSANLLEELGADDELVTLFTSAILSHHGKQEWGSPVVPITMEAMILHHIDNLSAKINATSEALSQVEQGEFTPRQYALERASLYKK